jgi:hypothetical protein
MLSVVMQTVVALNVVMLSVIMLSVINLSVIKLSDIKLSVVMLSVIMLNVVMLSVVAPRKEDALSSSILATITRPFSLFSSLRWRHDFHPKWQSTQHSSFLKIRSGI